MGRGNQAASAAGQELISAEGRQAFPFLSLVPSHRVFLRHLCSQSIRDSLQTGQGYCSHGDNGRLQSISPKPIFPAVGL